MNIATVVFKIKQAEYSLPIKYIKSIEKTDNIELTPELPAYMTGILNMAGETVPIFDFGYILHEEPTNIENDARVILIQTDGLDYGLLVHEVDEVFNIPSEAIQELGLIASHKMKYCSSFINVESRLITMVNPTGILEVLEELEKVMEFLEKQHV